MFFDLDDFREWINQQEGIEKNPEEAEKNYKRAEKSSNEFSEWIKDEGYDEKGFYICDEDRGVLSYVTTNVFVGVRLDPSMARTTMIIGIVGYLLGYRRAKEEHKVKKILEEENDD